MQTTGTKKKSHIPRPSPPPGDGGDVGTTGKVEGVEPPAVGGGDPPGVVGGKVPPGVIDPSDVGVYPGVAVFGTPVGFPELPLSLIMSAMWSL